MKTKPVISWPGGKSRLAETIIAQFPAHEAYVEVFGGGLAVYLAKERSKLEVVNDFDRDLVNFYRVARYHPNALLEELRLIPNSREEFLAFGQQAGLTDIQRAARWFVRNKISFGGKGEHFGTARTGGGAALGSRDNRLAAIEALNARFDKTCIENLDWRDVFRVYDSPKALFFLDPPYAAGHQYRVGAWTEADHVALRDRVLALQGAWLLTYDDHPLVREIYAGCQFQEVSQTLGIGNNHGRGARAFPQLIITPPGQVPAAKKETTPCP